MTFPFCNRFSQEKTEDFSSSVSSFFIQLFNRKSRIFNHVFLNKINHKLQCVNVICEWFFKSLNAGPVICRCYNEFRKIIICMKINRAPDDVHLCNNHCVFDEFNLWFVQCFHVISLLCFEWSNVIRCHDCTSFSNRLQGKDSWNFMFLFKWNMESFVFSIASRAKIV